MNPILISWSKFYCIDGSVNLSEAELQRLYTERFVQPLHAFQIEDPEEYSMVLQVLAQSGIMYPLRYLRAIAKLKTSIRISGLKIAIQDFKRNTVVFWTYNSAVPQPFPAWYDSCGQLMMDDIDDSTSVSLSEWKEADCREWVLYRSRLISTLPTMLLDSEVDAIDILVKSHLIEPEELRTVDFCDHTGQCATINALEFKNMPPRFVRQDIRSVPSNIVQEHDNNYYKAFLATYDEWPQSFSVPTQRWVEKNRDTLLKEN